MSNELQGTNLENTKGQDEFQEVEDLIKETLAETQVLENKAAQPAPVQEKVPEQAQQQEKTPVIVPPVEETKTKFEATEINLPRPVEAAAPQKKALPKSVPVTQGEKYDATFREYKVGDIVKGTVLKIDQSGVLVDIKYKADGLILPEEVAETLSGTLEDVVKVGQVIDVLIENLESKEGNVVLSKKQADSEVRWKRAYDAMRKKEVLDGKVIQALKGGLVVDCDGIRGFVPASQVQRQKDEPLDVFKDKTIPLKVIEVDRRQGKVTLSHRMAAGQKSQQDLEKVLAGLEVGQVRHGTVSSIKNFGAFVNIGGIDGLIHLSELSWKRVKHPSVLVKVGQELDVFVLGVDRVNKKVALGLKELQDDPWVKATDYYKAGQIIKVKIVRFAKFGAFAELDHDLEGLIHVSEMCKESVRSPEEAKRPDGQPIKIDDEVEVKVLRVIPEEQKIGLSIKGAIRKKEQEALKAVTPPPEENKVTIGDMVAQKEKERAEREAEEEETENEADAS
ncbi:hypothetical protein A2291_00985 [candidate division WOR-1 bacterium RIFOXYB2_FULL_42_35]|uniref:S1 motif domain-containing protein n=1 Tax=candidate division WOR-1 bacterium RIFOXYC2_FULL_41_25 TaxID=1802586 RepID=A0A1F4TNH3_UNCSA|nr:MAG: hypothetical protein A2247_05970 [candidate division WOR-1 bacterium RIFOXYA2_FULL_41_14]OGC23629.1 MAG: hypothetical protein A2291_00985 [candidate division WOR-1 bacterium RIFOXYB2_FULL_42_35]OGC33593.1 MAG: hypothetical protein A2462_02800 [candidate division WOR-1 bacterium RIFOXYC2_FULL_41_25]OGC43543.1 MAG: hypothetical protein A2548_04165 [candidate division WOR-1 bacterium RIFOXYD2_FULL_41_8]